MINAIIAAAEYLNSMRIHRMFSIPLAFFILITAMSITAPQVVLAALLWLLVALPFVGPPGMLIWLVNAWLRYVQSDFLFKMHETVLEVKIPKVIMKSPAAMERIFSDIVVTASDTTFIDRWWDGGLSPVYSFEIASFEGELHFYIWCEGHLKEYVKATVYAQYPDVEIFEVLDYTSGINYDPDKMIAMGREFRLTAPDAYPIKTYKGYELDKNPSKAEQRVDPLSSVFETLSNIGPGEQMWLQIVISQDQHGHAEHEAQHEIDKIFETLQEETLASGAKSKAKSKLQPAQDEQVKALTNTMDQNNIETGIRLMYLARKDSLHAEKFGADMKFIFKSFDSHLLNNIAGRSMRDHGLFDYPWQDIGGFLTVQKIKDYTNSSLNGFRFKRISRTMIDAYKRRCFFDYPYHRRHFIMTPEELATIYHYPTEETKTPGLVRIQSKKSEAPSDLPI